MTLLNPNDDISSVGAHAVEFRVTNSLGDVSVIEAEVDVNDKTYTELRMSPAVKLTDYLVYVDRYGYLDPMSCVSGISLSGVLYSVEEFKNGTLVIDDVGVDYNTPGEYRVLYTCDNKGEYYGSAVLIVIVTEVDR